MCILSAVGYVHAFRTSQDRLVLAECEVKN